PVNSVRLSGGGARSAFWQQMFADVFGKRVSVLESQEGSAYGAALLALVGTGEYGSVVDVCKAAIHEATVLDPQIESQKIYQDGHRTYQSLYPALKAKMVRE